MKSWRKWWNYTVLFFRWGLREKLHELRCLIWNAGIKLWWYRLWIRKDVSHPSLDLDHFAMLSMGKKRLRQYLDDNARRRKIAEIRELEAEDAQRAYRRAHQ
ncbi:MAG: hypothetical protein A2312_03865 [Candidatus Staskawiczbacteria bacterium RIFOXYB2_FULL_32_9]|uniref:Uncharacterized protein n=1 Tax=Candidatus Staskawiczbacteria bacterium RIFOXYD1_FULL_32_13 TaxID=1802234 RepID=A0A1G2JQH5_9BACT|nr:MAG: hypothetical protein UR22_C0008G0026 [Parcubacteria group bacterium GW2011_GWC2_32_10]OGZ78051.1 MAG: hypothetical protein A2256_01815 [Candidatus Staskawiczbacteria bacterium RIFOXYA2_FULL_32_7]OGZ78913.1 MAG: hypothetical protein A2360_01675 [Candidatus Staskawiczbacteria bacterium RIFOXYB1_FULL_32_11]OGZ83100.1 MAG: hypothetical protein A2312_03865 [Candidatus Staskawiczbacteria bacterium RIFOXYB2_FULL_32_9]OGZ88540.1 MAG: hypothetical protein A2561_04545 [Candidatus Staskawiczbacter